MKNQIKPFNGARGSIAVKRMWAEALKGATPKSILDELSKHLVGSTQAKKRLALAGYKHLKRAVAGPMAEHGVNSSIMLVGTTGCGKTHAVQTLAKTLDVPFVHVDCTSLTQSGYVGGSVNDIARKLEKLDKAEHAIIFLDEIDKLAATGSASDVGGAGVQFELLRVIEGTTIQAEARGGEQAGQPIHTGNMLFIAAGSFKDISWTQDAKSLGFIEEAKEDKGISKLTDKELEEAVRGYGLIPELLGRFSSITKLDSITEEVLLKILDLETGDLHKYIRMFADEGVQVEVSAEVKKTISSEALNYGTGARALTRVLERMFEEKSFDLLGNLQPLTRTLNITKEDVLGIKEGGQ